MKIFKILVDLVNGKYSKKKKLKVKPVKKNTQVSVIKPVKADIPHDLKGAKPILSIEMEISVEPEEGSVLDKPEYRELIENNKRLKELYHIQYERNLNGMEAEKNGDIETAIKYFEENVADNFEGNRPYDRLIQIYTDLKKFDDAIRIATKAVAIYDGMKKSGGEENPKLTRFKKTLAKLLSKHSDDLPNNNQTGDRL